MNANITANMTNIPAVRRGGLVVQDKRIVVSDKPDIAFIREVNRKTSHMEFCFK